MITYADILKTMNAELKEATAEVKKLENNFVEVSEIIKYLNAHFKEEQIKDKYFSFFTYCVRQNIDLEKTIPVK